MNDHGHDHEHGEHDHDHEHEHETARPNFSPQPVPMGINADLIPLNDGTDRVQVTYTSVNGVWVVFYDREGAIAHAQTLLTLAYKPPVKQEDDLQIIEEVVPEPASVDA